MSGIGTIGNASEFMLQNLSDRVSSRASGGSSGPMSIEGAQPGAIGSGKGPSFLETLKGTLDNVNQLQVQADKAAQHFAAGEGGNLHDVMIAMEKADIALRTAASVRNKMVEAYQEIMRMQV